MLKDINLLPFFINEDLFLLPQDIQQPENEDIAAIGSQLQQSNKTSTVTTSATSISTTPSIAEGKSKNIETPAKESKPKVNPNLIFGKNLKKLLILAEDNNNPVMERADGLLLKDILKAIGYTFDDVAIVNISHCRNEVDWEAVNAIPFQTLFSFGVSHPKVAVTSALAPYELEKSGERKFLLADKLSVLRQDRSRKIALWNLLKKFFM